MFSEGVQPNKLPESSIHACALSADDGKESKRYSFNFIGTNIFGDRGLVIDDVKSMSTNCAELQIHSFRIHCNDHNKPFPLERSCSLGAGVANFFRISTRV
mgnify:CR=1 FL=1